MKEKNTSNTDIIYLIKNLNKLLQNDFNSRLEQYGLTCHQGRVLFYLNKKVNIEHKVVHQNDIEKDFNLTKSSVSGLVKRMVANGLIDKKIAHPYAELTPSEKAVSIVDTVFNEKTVTVDKLMKGLSKKQVKILNETIQQMISNLESK